MSLLRIQYAFSNSNRYSYFEPKYKTNYARFSVILLKVTFRDIKKRVSFEITQQQCKLTEKLQNKPFWIWNIEEHKQEDVRTNGDCCFNHLLVTYKGKSGKIVRFSFR